MLQQQPTSAEVELHDLPANDDIPEESDLMSFSENEGQVLDPPARIVARFHKPSTNRRRSSATSSRRNSISSSHSHQSNRSYRTSCQSNHVAQNLRRASIIESRKARFAAREAHAEQVRIRAALAKAAPRFSNSEERALAAQQARERHLAQVAAACAEEVKRAKKVAEDMKERKAAEERRYRLEMEEKLAEAEKRRLEYQRNARRPRTASTAAVDARRPVIGVTPALDRDAAANRIQIAWRDSRRKRTVQAFLDLGLSIERVRQASFEEVGSLLSEDKVLALTAKVLELFGLQNKDDLASTHKTGTREFLSGYLILGHPTAVLSKDGDQEQDLINKAKELVISFESALSKLSMSNRYTPSPTQLELVSMAHSSFTAAFSAWKAQDSSTLIETMVATFANLDAIWQSVKDDRDGEVANDYKEGIRNNQVILLAKIKKLAGPERGTMLIRKAIRESRRNKTRRKPVGDFRPRLAVEDRRDTISVASTSPEGDLPASTSVIPESTASPEEADASKAAAFARLFSPLPPNRILTHEVAIDKEYVIERSPLLDAMYRDMCENMRKGFEQGEGDIWTVAMAENVRSKLLHLLNPKQSLYTVISEALDPELIRTQCSKGVFSYEKFFSFMATILPKLCAPFRDAQVAALAELLQQPGDLEAMVERQLELLRVIDLLSVDYSNFLLRTAVPTLIKGAANFEQREFAKDLETGTITLEKTKRWWRNASVNVLTEADQRDPLHRPSVQRMYARGLVDLAIASTPLQDADIPETLQMDKTRLSRMRADAVRITTIGAILLTAKNLLKRDVRAQWKAEANRMWEALKDGYTNEENSLPTRILSIVESSHPMPPASKAQLASTITRLLGQADSGRLTDPVMKVLFQRLKTHILNRISASSSGERVRAVSTAGEGLATSGLPEFIGQVSEIVDQLTRISEVDRKAHGVWYEQVAREVEAMGVEEA